MHPQYINAALAEQKARRHDFDKDNENTISISVKHFFFFLDDDVVLQQDLHNFVAIAFQKGSFQR